MDARAEEGEPPLVPSLAEGGGLVARLPAAGGEDGRLAAELIERQAAELATRDAEIASLREELARSRAEAQPPGAGGHGALAPASERASELVTQTVDGADAPPDFEAGALRQAAMDGDLAAVQQWLAAGINPNAAHELLAGWTPLHYAAQLGYAEITGELLDHGALAQPLDRFEETPLMQAGYWGYTEVEALLQQRGGGETRPMLAFSGDDARVGRWDRKGYVTILCSAPEFSLSGDGVMVALFALCDIHGQKVKFGYDWAGSSTAEAADLDPQRRVPACCHSLACSCGANRSAVMIIGSVDWSNPLSVAGSMWFPKVSTQAPPTAA